MAWLANIQKHHDDQHSEVQQSLQLWISYKCWRRWSSSVMAWHASIHSSVATRTVGHSQSLQLCSSCKAVQPWVSGI